MLEKWRGYYHFLFLPFLLLACGESSFERGQVLFTQKCSTCHLLPEINDLPKFLWEEAVLPEMAARMGIKEGDYNPVKDFPYEELLAVNKARVYGQKPLLTEGEWKLLKAYILDQAPDSIPAIDNQWISEKWKEFTPVPVALNTVKGSQITFLHFDTVQEKLLLGDMRGHLMSYDYIPQKAEDLNILGNPVPAFHMEGDQLIVTAIGLMNPSEQALGKIFRIQDGQRTALAEDLHRPVHTMIRDLNQDGKEEMLVSEFGDLTGKLSLFVEKDSKAFQKKVLSTAPGHIRSIAQDMNGDGIEDIVALAAQGDEGISIFYQEGDLLFREERVLRFSPLSGLSWFELIDYDGDGDQDIITLHGDNADKTYVPKSYHGMRIHINDGRNQFEQKFTFPMHGVTRSITRDFDQDGDWDIGLIATFPNYDDPQLKNFVYLENKNSSSFTFEAYTFPQSDQGRWFLIEAADLDKDGDEDIILSSFTYSFTPVPKELEKRWYEDNVDLMILHNNHMEN